MSTRRTQRDRILDLLRANKGKPVPSPILARISLQYGARVKELRQTGYQIRNEVKRINGVAHGSFTLESESVIETLKPAYCAGNQLPEMSFETSSFLDYERGVRR